MNVGTADTFQRMEIDAYFTTLAGSLMAMMTVLSAVALSHPEPQVRVRAERILAMIFRAR